MKDWKHELKELFIRIHNYEGDVEDIKGYINTENFISKLISQEREKIVEWAKDKKEKCEKLKNSQYINETEDYFNGKIAILEDLINLIQK